MIELIHMALYTIAHIFILGVFAYSISPNPDDGLLLVSLAVLGLSLIMAWIEIHKNHDDLDYKKKKLRHFLTPYSESKLLKRALAKLNNMKLMFIGWFSVKSIPIFALYIFWINLALTFLADGNGGGIIVCIIVFVICFPILERFRSYIRYSNELLVILNEPQTSRDNARLYEVLDRENQILARKLKETRKNRH